MRGVKVAPSKELEPPTQQLTPHAASRQLLPTSSSTGLVSQGNGLRFSKKQHSSITRPHSMGVCPSLNLKLGSLASYLFAPHPTPGSGLCLSPDGLLMIRYGFSPDIKLLKTSTAALVDTLIGSAGSVTYATFCQNSRFVLAASEDCQLMVFDVALAMRGQPPLVSCTDVGLEPLLYCLLSPDSTAVLSCDDDGQLELWNVKETSMISRFEPGHSSKLANFARGGNALVSCSNGVVGVVVLDTTTSEVLFEEDFDRLVEQRNKPAYAISKDGLWVIAYIQDQTWSDNLAVFDTTKCTYEVLKVCDGAALHAEFSADGEMFFAAGRDNQIHIFETGSALLLGSLEGHSSSVMFCGMSPDGKLAISGDNAGSVILWDTNDYSATLRLQAHRLPVLFCDLSSNGLRVVSLDSGGNAYLWNLDSQAVFDILRTESDKLCICTVTEDCSQMVVGYEDGSVRLWDIGLESRQVWEQTSHAAPVVALSVCLKQQLVASGSNDGILLLSSIADGAVKAKLKVSHRTIMGIEFSTDGSKLMVSCRDGYLRMWTDLVSASSGAWGESPPPASLFLKAPAQILSSALSPEGHLAVAGCSNGSLSLWDLETEALKFCARVSDLGVSSVHFSSDGLNLLIGTEDSSCYVFDHCGVRLRSICTNASGIVCAYFEDGTTPDKAFGSLGQAVTVCSRQAHVVDLSGPALMQGTADFLWDPNRFMMTSGVEGRDIVAHSSMALYDAALRAAIINCRSFEAPPGDSYMFRSSTAVIKFGAHNKHLIIHANPHDPLSMLMNETGGAKSIDFSSDGHLMVCGSIRGELTIWAVEHKLQIKSWLAHKRSTVTCVKFSHDAKHVYSCGEDCKVILWDWRTQAQLALLSGHATSVVAVEMSLDGTEMVSGDMDGMIIIWDTQSQEPRQVIAAHDGPVLYTTMSPDGKLLASSGVDEHISIRNAMTGAEIQSLDEALDGKGLTIKFSFDGSRLQVGGENGNILIWSLAEQCLLYEIKAHEGPVYDCSWSGDSRQLLSVGADGRVRLWDAAAGSEICEANFEVGYSNMETGGFIRADISTNGATMVGCTAKGHLIQWDIERELNRRPNGGMLYAWLDSMPLVRARKLYVDLQSTFPLIINAQDSKGWTVLMHAVAHKNGEITKLITGSVRPKSAILGLTASLPNTKFFDGTQTQNRSMSSKKASSGSRRGRQATTSASGYISHSETAETAAAEYKGRGLMDLLSSFMGIVLRLPVSWRPRSRAVAPEQGTDNTMGMAPSAFSAGAAGNVFVQHGSVFVQDPEPNALSIAIESMSADCVSHLLDAVLAEKVTGGSYAAVTKAMPAVTRQYPEMCFRFLQDLPLLVLGEMEVPVSIAAQGTLVMASTSYTSHKEMWHGHLNLDQEHARGAKVMMQASMVRLPYAASLGEGSLLCTLVEGGVPVKTFGCKSVKSIINYKWKKYAKRKIFTKALVYLVFIAVFTTYAIIHSDDTATNSLSDLTQFGTGRLMISLSIVILLFGVYYLTAEFLQMIKLGFRSYFGSFWNYLDLSSYSICLVISACQLLRVGLDYSEFAWPLIAIETVLLWVKATFFGLAVDGLGTFIYMIIKIVQGMRDFLLIVLILWLMFTVALMNLFPESFVYGNTFPAAYNSTASGPVDPEADTIWVGYNNFGRGLLTSYMVTYGSTNYGPLGPFPALVTRHPEVAIILICLFNFVICLLFMSMLITLFNELYRNIRSMQDDVFLQNRADLVIEVESTMTEAELKKKVPPFLHLLTPFAEDSGVNDTEQESQMKSSKLLEEALRQSKHPAVQRHIRRLNQRGKNAPDDAEAAHDEASTSFVGRLSLQPVSIQGADEEMEIMDGLLQEMTRVRALVDSLLKSVESKGTLDEDMDLSTVIQSLSQLGAGVAQQVVDAMGHVGVVS